MQLSARISALGGGLATTATVIGVTITKDPIQSAITAPTKQAQKLLKELYKSLTWDRGSEMAAHRKFTISTKIEV